MSLLRIGLEQWQALVAVVQEGGFVNAANRLNKTQPGITYSIHKIEELLKVKLFKIQGRRADLTKEGKELYLHAVKLVRLAENIELKAQGKPSIIERTLRLAVDEIYPLDRLMQTLQAFSEEIPDVKLMLVRGVLSGPADLIDREEVDIAITYKHPKHIITELFFETTSALYVSFQHPLSQINRPIKQTDLLLERQIIVRDSNQQQSMDVGWLNPQNAWYVDTLELKLHLLCAGLGYSWLNEELAKKRNLPLKRLELETGTIRKNQLYLAYREDELLRDLVRAMRDLLVKYAKR